MKRIHRLIATGLLTVLTACVSSPEIRVEKPPEPPVIAQPVLKIDLITKETPASQVADAYYEAVVKLRAALDEAINALNVYRR